MIIKFGVKLGEQVFIKLPAVQGVVHGVCAYRSGYQRFLVAYAAEGKQQEDWFDLEDLVPVRPRKAGPVVKRAPITKKSASRGK